MDITPEQIRQLGTLARLELSDTEVEKLAEQLPKIVEYVGQLQQVDTIAVSTPIPVPPTLRPDVTEVSPAVDQILKQAPERMGDHWQVEAVFS